jgi:hypothetical protein
MIGQDTREVERKVIAILKVLGDSPEPVGARVIARRLKEQGIDLTERAVRYHLKLMDERGFTQGRGRDGRLITPSGREELRSALVQDKVGFVIAKIELLAYRTSFDVEKRSGEVPINTTFFPKKRFREALEAMKDAFSAGLCVSDLVAVASEGERLGESIVPEGMVGLATVCSIVVNGVLLKSGVPMNSKFGGILQIRKGKPLRFVELIEYSGTSLDPSEVFITSRMTSVGEVATRGEGKILANFREIPAPSRPVVERVIQKLSEANLGGVVTIGETSEPVCEIPVGLNKIGMILLGGLNPVAAAVERGV